LAQAMMQQSLESARPAAGDLLQASVDQRVASHEFSANVKTVQAFDAMLEELTRIKQPEPNE
jgi:flagellar hook protein FlgE